MTMEQKQAQPVRGPLRGDIAIIGMACMFPGASNLATFWQNIVGKVSAIIDAPPDRWDPEVFFDPDSTSNDRVYCKRGGYLTDLPPFNPAEFGVMPLAVEGSDPEQFLCLQVAQAALEDAGYKEPPPGHERTEIIMGRGNYVSRAAVIVLQHTLAIEQTIQILRNLHPEYSEDELATIRRELKASLPRYTAETAPAVISNLTTGRVSNRLDLMGPNFTVDAACASALIATEVAVQDLLSGKCDLALVGGVHLSQHLPFLTVFSQLKALSRSQQIRPFDKDADGTLTGEGVGVIVLKRLADAERDGNRIYAVIKGVGSASDGRAQGILVPRVDGEELALRRAYEMAGIPPQTVELIEAHGTGTPVGDVAEIQSLTRVFGERQGALPTCAIGSIKSMIGHCMPAAGIAGLIKTALAVYHKVLPPTLNCNEPNPRLELEKTPFYINTETRPWVHGAMETPRRAGVNSFGFGGINGHVILEEYVPTTGQPKSEPSLLTDWETEVFILQSDSRDGLLAEIQRVQSFLEGRPQTNLKDLAFTLNVSLRDAACRLAVVAASVDDLKAKLKRAHDRLSDPGCRQIREISGIYYFEEPLGRQGGLAFLFPGEGAQYPGMMTDLCLHFPEVRECFDVADRTVNKLRSDYLPGQCVFPPPFLSEAERQRLNQRLWDMSGVVETVITADRAMLTLLEKLGVQPDAVVGHSSGDFVAMLAAGIIKADDEALEQFATLGAAYDRLAEAGKLPEAGMITVGADRAAVAPLLRDISGLTVAMDNCPHQIVLVGGREAIEQAGGRLRSEGIICEVLPVDRPYHTAEFAAASGPLRDFVAKASFAAPDKCEIYSCTTASAYPQDVDAIRRLIVDHWVQPVQFQQTIEEMYAKGIRIFVEVGPRGNLTAFVDDILRGRPHLALASNLPKRSGITQLNHLVGLLAAHRVPLRLDYLYERRSPQWIEMGEGGQPAADGRPPRGIKMDLSFPLMHIAGRTNGRARATAASAESNPVAATAGQAEREQAAPQVTSQGSEAATSPAASTAQDAAATGGVEAAVPPASHTAEASPVSPAAGAPAPGAMGAPALEVIQEFMHTMEGFLDVQQQVMEAFLGGPPAGSAGGLFAPVVAAGPQDVAFTPSNTTRSQGAQKQFPFVDEIASLVPGQEVVVRHRLTMDRDVFLCDHTLGAEVSEIDTSLRALPMVPLTMSIEIMAEVAALLAPGRLMVGVRQARAQRPIQLDQGDVTIEINAKRKMTQGDATDAIDVQVWQYTDGDDSAPAGRVLVGEGTVLFGDRYVEAPSSVAPFAMKGERACQYTARQMYENRFMFHGPRFQRVVSLDRIGENGILGQLDTIAGSDLFATGYDVQLLTDPAFLDAVTQLVGYWAKEAFNVGYTVLPIQITELDIYGPTPPAGTRLFCQLEIQQAESRLILSSGYVFDENGRAWLRIGGLGDWRFYWTDDTYEFSQWPKRKLLAQPWPTAVARLPRSLAVDCFRLEPVQDMPIFMSRQILAHLALSADERKTYYSIKGPEKRQIDWLFGRIVAKDAVRAFLKRQHGIEMFPADIVIGKDEHGRPVAQIAGAGPVSILPELSMAHTNGLMVALVAAPEAGLRPGIDIERVQERPLEFIGIAFDSEEQGLLAGLDGRERDERVARFWCAKEAVCKALGKGLIEGPRSLSVRSFDAESGDVTVVLGRKLAELFPDLEKTELIVYTAQEGDLIVATTLCERRV